jgi:RNA polymerase sigma-70 factor (ECF subfamily)
LKPFGPAILEIDLRHLNERAVPADAGTAAPLDLAALTRRMIAGDEMAWRTFHDAYFDRLWRYLLVVAAGNEDAAREALQIALVRVTRHLKIFENEEIFWSWLTVLARSAFADERRKKRRYFSFLERFTVHAETEPVGRAGDQADEQLHGVLERTIAMLPPEEQELIALKYFAHRSVREIADELQTTEKGVESKLSRIRLKLKDAALAKLKNETQS